MLTDIPVLAVTLALLGVVVGLQVVDAVRRGRARRRSSVPGIVAAPTPLMSPARWAAVGVVILLLGIFWPSPRGPRGFAPGPDPGTPTPPKKSAVKPPAGAGSTGGAKAAPQNVTTTDTASSTTESPTPDATAAALPPDEAAAEERRWCNQGDRMMAVGQYGMAAQAYWEALRVRPQSQRARTGLTRARRTEAEAETARIEARGTERATSDYTPSSTSRMPREQSSSPANRPAAPAAGGRWNSHEDARFHTQRGDRLLEQGMAGAAIAEYEKALESSPSDARAHEGLARARSQAAPAR